MNINFKNFKFHTKERDINISSLRFRTNRVSDSLFLPKLSRFINKHFYNWGLGSVINRYDNSISIYSSKQDKILYKEFEKDSIFCNFGSGAFYHKKWKNYDYPGNSKYYKNLQGIKGKDFIPINLCSKNLKIPEKNNSVSLIYCSHSLEHLEEKSASNFLSECFRILKKNGVMRIVLPDTWNDFKNTSILFDPGNNINSNITNIYIRDSASNILSDTINLNKNQLKKLFFQSKFNGKKFFEIAKTFNKVSTNFNIHNPERHISFWNKKKLLLISKNIGFSKYLPLYRGSSIAKPFMNTNIFDNCVPEISFYFEIQK
jgi:predicted SAM-dependent methyltransferase